MVGWHHWLDGHEFEQAPEVGDEQGSLVCCSPWGRKELDTTEQLNWTNKGWTVSHCVYIIHMFIHSSAVGHLSWFHLLVTVNNASMNMGYKSVPVFAFKCFGCTPWNRTEGFYINSVFRLWGSPLLFTTAVSLFYFIPLYGRIMHLMDLPYLAYLFIHWWTF